MKVQIWELPNIKTNGDVIAAFNWCFDNLGPPDERWTYGKDKPDFLRISIINSLGEIDYIDFVNEEDSIVFKLRF